MLSKKPKKATDDLHKDILGTRNPGLGYMAKRAQPVLYDADTFLHPAHHPVSIWNSEDVLVHQVVSMKKMNEKPGHVRPAKRLLCTSLMPLCSFLRRNYLEIRFHKRKNNTKTRYVSEWCYDYAKQFVEQQWYILRHFKKHIQSANDTLIKEVKDMNRFLMDLDAEYKQCVLENRN
ncbi:hypothetical protein Tco_1548841 [Tanacetum coccineum]